MRYHETWVLLAHRYGHDAKFNTRTQAWVFTNKSFRKDKVYLSPKILHVLTERQFIEILGYNTTIADDSREIEYWLDYNEIVREYDRVVNGNKTQKQAVTV